MPVPAGRLRQSQVIAENMFGKDAALPETKISYRVQSRVGQKTAIQGRDQTYLLPAQSVRVMSLVPREANDRLRVARGPCRPGASG